MDGTEREVSLDKSFLGIRSLAHFVFDSTRRRTDYRFIIETLILFVLSFFFFPRALLPLPPIDDLGKIISSPRPAFYEIFPASLSAVFCVFL